MEVLRCQEARFVEPWERARGFLPCGFPIEAGQQQLRHSNARTTLGHTDFSGGAVERAMAEVSEPMWLDAVGRETACKGQYLQ